MEGFIPYFRFQVLRKLAGGVNFRSWFEGRRCLSCGANSYFDISMSRN